MEKYKQKIKGLIISGEIKTCDNLTDVFDSYASAFIQSNVGIAANEMDNEKPFKEWRENVEVQFNNMILQTEKED